MPSNQPASDIDCITFSRAKTVINVITFSLYLFRRWVSSSPQRPFPNPSLDSNSADFVHHFEIFLPSCWRLFSTRHSCLNEREREPVEVKSQLATRTARTTAAVTPPLLRAPPGATVFLESIFQNLLKSRKISPWFKWGILHYFFQNSF